MRFMTAIGLLFSATAPFAVTGSHGLHPMPPSNETDLHFSSWLFLHSNNCVRRSFCLLPRSFPFRHSLPFPYSTSLAISLQQRTFAATTNGKPKPASALQHLPQEAW